MGFDIAKHEAIIDDEGKEMFTGTTLEGIGQSVVGVLQHLQQTANRFVTVLSIKTCQEELLAAFEQATKPLQDNSSPRESSQSTDRQHMNTLPAQWKVSKSTIKEVLERGQEKKKTGGGWTLDLAIVQLLDHGKGRGVVAQDWETSDSSLLGVRKLTVEDVVGIVLARR